MRQTKTHYREISNVIGVVFQVKPASLTQGKIARIREAISNVESSMGFHRKTFAYLHLGIIWKVNHVMEYIKLSLRPWH